MGISDLKRQADALTIEARRLKVERNAHAGRGVGILRARLATPAALALCFGAGFLLGHPFFHESPASRHEPENGRTGDSSSRSFLESPFVAVALRLASGFLAGAVTGPASRAAAPPPGSSASGGLPSG